MDKKKVIGKLFYWGLVIAFFWFISQSLSEIEDVVDALRKGNPIYILLAMVFQTLYFLFWSQLATRMVESIGERVEFLKVFQFNVASAFMGVSAPGGALAGLIYQTKKIAELTERRTARIAAIFGVLLNQWYTAFIVIVFSSVWVAKRHGVEYATMLGAALIFVLFLLGMVFILWFIMEHPGRLAQWAERGGWASRFIKKTVGQFGSGKDESWFEDMIHDMSGTMGTLYGNRSMFWSSLVSGGMLHLIHITVLFYVFAAFNVTFSPGLLLVTYATAFLFTVVSPTPQGIGFVEGLMQVVLVAFGVGAGKALLVALTYRAISLWIPIMTGFVMFRYLEGDGLLKRYFDKDSS